MNRKELIDAIAEKTGSTKADTGRTIEALFDFITAGLKKSNVALGSFGTFEVRKLDRVRLPSGTSLLLVKPKAIVFNAGTKLETAIIGAKRKI